MTRMCRITIAHILARTQHINDVLRENQFAPRLPKPVPVEQKIEICVNDSFFYTSV